MFLPKNPPSILPPPYGGGVGGEALKERAGGISRFWGPAPALLLNYCYSLPDS